MMATTQAEASARLMDAERTRLENRGLSTIGPASRAMRRAVLSAYRTGNDPGEAIRAAMVKVADTLTDGMVAADLQARLRTQIVYRKVRKPKDLRLSAFDEARQLLERRLGMTGPQLSALRDQYRSAAVSATTEIGTSLERNVQEAIRDAIGQGLPTRQGASLVRKAFENSGVTIDRPYLFETVYRTQLQTAYSAGRWNAAKAPEIDEILWGFEYVGVMDDRTTDLCADLDGTRKAKGDAFWDRFTPPNHYNCRSQMIEVFNDDRLAVPTKTPDVTPAIGFANNPGEIFGSAA